MLYDYLKELDGIMRVAHLGDRDGDRLARRQPEVSSRSSRSSRGTATPTSTSGPRASPGRPPRRSAAMRPLGMVWNALALQYRFGFQASSDHISTHISYAIAIAEDATPRGGPRRLPRAPLLRRHRQHPARRPLRRAHHGRRVRRPTARSSSRSSSTGPGRSRGSTSSRTSSTSTRPSPSGSRVEFQWTDEENRPPGLSWYYVRAIQDDGELAWGSPIWVNSPRR